MAKNKHLGSSLDDFLADEGTISETTATAIKKTLVWQFKQAMEEKGWSKGELANQIDTSPAVISRLLDSEKASINLQTAGQAARALGKRLVIYLE